MNQFEFVDRRRPIWEEFEKTLSILRRRNPDAVTVERFARLYRQVTSDLAFANTHFPNSAVAQRLNLLVAEGHGQMYGHRLLVSRRLVRYFRHTFPDTLRMARAYFITSTAVFLLAAIFAFAAVRANPGLGSTILPIDIADAGKGATGFGADAGEVSGLIMANNIQVAFVAFALGVFFGLGTIYALTMNGLLLGALAAAFAQNKMTLFFWSMILPHGMLELPAIFVAAAAGLMIGDSLIRPGDFGRLDALRTAAGRAVILVGGVIPVFIVAGLIEGFITPMDIPVWSKFAVSAVSGLVGLAYLCGFPRSRACPAP